MTSQTSPRRSLRSLALALSALLLTGGGVLIGAAPAFAHDELVSSDPAAGSSVDALPAAITLTYSAELLSDGSATVVQVTDAAGTDLADGAPSVAGAVVTQPLTGSGTGDITVVWRVVSSDGHPISGEFGFTSTASAAPTAEPTAEPSPTASASATPSPEATTLQDTSETADAAPAVWPWIVGGVVVVVVIALIVWLLGARARQQKRASEERTAGRGGPTGR